MQMLHFRVPTSCNGMRLNIFLRTMGVSSACIKAVKYQGTGFCVRLGDEVIPVHTDYRVATAQIVSFALPPEPPPPMFSRSRCLLMLSMRMSLRLY